METESRTRQSKLRDNLTVWFRCHVCPRAYTNVKKFVEHTSICKYCQINGGNFEGDVSTPETEDKRSGMKDISVPDTSTETENIVRSPFPTTTADTDVGPASSNNSDPDPRMTRTMTRPGRQIIKQVTTNCDFEWSSESADQDKCGKMGSRDWKSHDDDNDENDCMHSNNTTSASDNSNDDYGYNISNKTCRLNSSSRRSVKKPLVPNQRRYTVKRTQELISFPNSESNPIIIPVPERVAKDRARSNYTHKGSRKTSFLNDQITCTDSIKSSTTMLILEKDLSRSDTWDMDFWTNWPTNNTEGNDIDCDDTDSSKNMEILKSNSSSNIPDSAVFNKCTSKNTKNSENLDLKDSSSSCNSSSSTSSSKYAAGSSSDSDSDSDYTPFPITKIVSVKSLERKFDNAVAATKRRLVKQNLNPKQGHVRVPEPQPMSAPLLLPKPLQVPFPLLKYPERKIMIDEEALANQALYSTNNFSEGDRESSVLYLNHETGLIESIESARAPLFFTSDPPSNKENDDFWLNWTSDDDESNSNSRKTVNILKGGTIDLIPLASRHPGLESTQRASKQVSAQAKRKIYRKSRQCSKYLKIDEDQQIVKNSKICTVTTNNNNRSDDGKDSTKFINSNVYTYDSSSDSPCTDNVELIEISSGSNCSSSSSTSSVTSVTSDSSDSSIDNIAEDRTDDGDQNGEKKIKKRALPEPSQTQRHKSVCPILKLSQHLSTPSSRKRALALQIVKHKSSKDTLQDSPKTKNQEEDHQKLQKPLNQRKNRNDSSQTSLMNLPLSIAARIRQNIKQRTQGMISTQSCETKAVPKE